ncbi:hypothetical protein QBC42DRAFT_210787 [Cladorrhinum samala]|uniref:Uncharacterized protein n=1 Tax=Cladorrhinum samala TaxID=585594 RepID=A0AAV9HEA1_9PEZI|nr:hypothetical protein QBC42DRAFT_210787 [Cladorrhinum samala]
MFDNYIAAHGLAAIVDSSSGFSIKADKGSAYIRPHSANQLMGWIYYALPSPPPGNDTLKKLAIDFSSTAAYVSAVHVYLGNNEVYKADNMQQASSFTEDISSSQAVFKDKGILVAIHVVFDSVAASFHFQSVSIGI